MARRRKNNSRSEGEAIAAVVTIFIMAMVFLPGFRQGVIIFMMAIVAVVCFGTLACKLIRHLGGKSDSPGWNFGRRRTLRTGQPLRSFNMSTLEAVPVKEYAASPPPVDDNRFRPKVWVSPSPIINPEVINPAVGSVDGDPVARRHAPIIPTIIPAGTKLFATADLIGQLRAIDWFQFEKVVALMYERQGYAVDRRGGANPDGGIDMVIEGNGARRAVQCKQWKGWKLQEKTVREFVGALHIAGISQGVLVILSGCSAPARQLAQEREIEIVDDGALARMLEAAGASYDPEVRALLDDERKFCPKCESEMVLRTTRKGSNAGGHFWGCSTYPRCKFMMQIQ